MQFTSVQVSVLMAEIFSVAILLVESLARGYGFAGPRWKSRHMGRSCEPQLAEGKTRILYFLIALFCW
jgi:hypothetical protein